MLVPVVKVILSRDLEQLQIILKGMQIRSFKYCRTMLIYQALISKRASRAVLYFRLLGSSQEIESRDTVS